MESTPSLSSLVTRIREHRDATGRRALVGLVGEPGAGKSTVAEVLVGELSAHGVRCALVPMDGFHLANVALARRGASDRKGAIDTFDGDGYVALLRRLATFVAPEVVHAPTYDRTIEESVAGAIEVDADVEVVVTEGNYLLVDAAPWGAVADLLDLAVFVRVDPGLRRRRLVARHIRFGKSPEAAEAWVRHVDEPNAEQIRATAGRADVTVEWH